MKSPVKSGFRKITVYHAPRVPPVARLTGSTGRVVNFEFPEMKVALGADHAGFLLKEQIRANLEAQGVEVHDFGTASQESTDYPDYAAKVAREVAAGHFDRGILVCSTGVGMSIAANKVEGIRAALGVNVEEVALTRGHNDANVLTLGAKYTDLPKLPRRWSKFF